MQSVAARRLARLLLTVVSAVLLQFASTLRCTAQSNLPVEPEPQAGAGANPWSTYSGIKDNVNLENGNLSLCVPLVSLPGPQMPPGMPSFDLNIPLCYNSNFEVMSGGAEGPILSWFPWTWVQGTPPMGPGWTLTGHPGLFAQPGTTSTGNPIISMPDGSTYSLSGWSGGPQGEDPTGPDQQGADVYFSHGSSDDLILKNGITVTPQCYLCGGTPEQGPSEQSGYNEVETDTQGDTITFSDNLITDAVGRQVTVSSTASSISFTYPDPTVSGRTQTVTVDFENVAFNCSGSEVGITAPVNTYEMPTSVVLPNGLQYTFQYDACGVLRQINYPDGGYTRYSYTEVQLAVVAGNDQYYPYPVNEVTQKAVCPVPVSVTPYTDDQCPVPEEVTTYQPVSGGYNNSQNTVIDPAANANEVGGTKTVYQFSQADPDPAVESQGSEISRQIYDYSSNRLLKTVTTTYLTSQSQAESACENIPGGWVDLPTLPATQITQLDNGLQSEVAWHYNCNMIEQGPTQLMEKDEYDFGAQPDSTLLRKTTYTWANLDDPSAYGWPTSSNPNAKHILDRKTSVIVSDGNGKQLSKTLYSYDVDGRLISTQKWRSTDGAMLTTTWNNWTYTYPNGTTVSYGFANNYAGGENPSSSSYPTTITTVANGVSYVQQKQYYYGSGLVAAACGNNFTGTCKVGLSHPGRLTDPDYTSYTYDLLGRETSAIAGDGGETTTCYSDDPGSSCYSSSGPLTTVTTKLIQSGVSETTTDSSMYTGAGNVPTTTAEVNSDPNCSGGTVNVDTTYDADGRKATVSNPYCSTNPGAPTSGTTTYTYDALSRVTQVTNPDSTTTTNSYTGRAVLSADEGNGTNRIERISQNDALGRLLSVCEITNTVEQGSSSTPAACGQDIAGTGFLTSYGYDASNSNGPLDAVTSVTQGAVDRSFTYDSLGEILSASNPESGNTTYSYDTMGNLISKTDADSITTTYGYNGLNQLLSESYSDGTTPSDCFQYGQSTSGYGMGRLVAEWTQAGTCSSTVPSSGAITERSFTYDRMGRVANDQQCTSIDNCGTSTASATVNYTYDLAGDVASVNNGLTGSSAMTFDNVYNAADELATISGPESPGTGSFSLFGSSSYTPAHAIASALVGPGISLSRSYNNRLLPTAETDTVGTTPGTTTVQITGAEQSFGSDDNEVLFSGTESSGMTSAYNVMIAGPNNYLASWTVNATSSDTPNSMAAKVVNAINTGTCATHGVPYQVSGTGSAAFIQSCQDGSTYYFSAAFRDSCNGGSGSCFSISGGQTDSYDTGTVSLTVNGTQVASASYGEGSTPSTIVSALVSASSGNNLVTLTAGTCSGDTCNLTVTAQDDGTQTDYSYAVSVDDTSAFGGTSFANSASSGDLAGGTNVPLYNWAINSYAPDGDVLSMTDSVEGAWSYTYDDMNRVLTADASTGPDAGMDLTWAYDRYGNRWSQTATGSGGGGATQPSLTFNGNTNRADGYSYDAAGNLLNDGLTQYVYDGANRVLSINGQSTGYVYDAEGNRVAKLSSGGSVETVYVLTGGNQQLTELNGSGGWNHTNIYAPGGRLLATYDASGQPSPGYHYNLTDWLATKRMQTTASGNSHETCTSNPFGDGLSCTGGADATEQHFTGKDHDTESNLDYFYARYYSETLGRFMTPDWAAAPAAVPYADYGDPQSLNLYAYVLNNPLTGIDETGHYSSSDPMADAQEGVEEYWQGLESSLPGEAEMAGTVGMATAPTCIGCDGPPVPPENPDANGSNNTPALPNPNGVVPVPGCPTCEWVWHKDNQNPRGGRWDPKGWKGPNPPSLSPDPDGHWDLNKGDGSPVQHLDPNGKPISPEEAHPGNQSPTKFIITPPSPAQTRALTGAAGAAGTGALLWKLLQALSEAF